jgi:hypothetical protein
MTIQTALYALLMATMLTFVSCSGSGQYDHRTGTTNVGTQGAQGNSSATSMGAGARTGASGTNASGPGTAPAGGSYVAP